MNSVKKTSKPLIGGIAMMLSGVLGLFGTMNYWIGIGEAGSGFGKGDHRGLAQGLQRSQTAQRIESQNAHGVCLYNDWILSDGAAKCGVRSGTINS